MTLLLDSSLDVFCFQVYSLNGVEQVVLGLHIVRGDNIALIGQIDDKIDSRLDFQSIRAEPLNPVVY